MLAYNLSLWTLFPIKTVIRQKLMLLSNLLRRLHLKVFVFLGIVSSALINVYSIIYVGLGTLSSPSIANSVSLLPGHGHSMASRFANSMLSKQRRQADASKIIDPLKLRIQGGPTFLLGIPTIQDEVERRQAVRETYLSFFKDLYHEDQPNRVCSLAQIQRNISLFLECQVVYFFFLGGNPNGPTELVAPNSSFPMTIEGNLDEDDLIYFNIRENLEDGKSQTFFKYASMLSKEIQFDYVGKIDSDTLLFLPAFLDFAAIHLPPRQLLVYGGNPHDRNACDTNSHDSHTCPLELVGQLYMGGSFYWMSPDLAEFITSNAVPRSQLTVRHEDIDIGNFVFTYPNVYEGKNIRVVNVTGSQLLIHQLVDGNWMFRNRATSLSGMLWAHSLNDGQYPGPFFKDLRHFRKVWRQFQWYWLSNKTLVVSLFTLRMCQIKMPYMVRCNSLFFISTLTTINRRMIFFNCTISLIHLTSLWFTRTITSFQNKILIRVL